MNLDLKIKKLRYVNNTLQNLDIKTRQQVQALPLTGGGDSDLYLAAIELALTNSELVCMICPSSWMNSKSAIRLRN